MTEPTLSSEAELRQAAIAQLRKKRDFYGHLLTFAVINGLFVFVWWKSGFGFFWPIFPIALWGISRMGRFRQTTDRNAHT